MAIARARLGRYAQWQLRDYVIGPGGITILFVLLPLWFASRSVWISTTHGEGAPELDWLIHFIAVLGSVFATSGLIADDRSRGYYRFLLARPMDPLRYYGQAFVLRGLVVILIAAFSAGVASVIGRPIPMLGAIIYTAISYVLVGGITICQSTVWRFAWVGSLFLVGASDAIAALASPDGELSAGWRTFWYVLHVLLPPFSQEGAIHQLLMGAPHWGALTAAITWSLCYGLLAIAAAALVIKGLEWGR